MFIRESCQDVDKDLNMYMSQKIIDRGTTIEIVYNKIRWYEPDNIIEESLIVSESSYQRKLIEMRNNTIDTILK